MGPYLLIAVVKRFGQLHRKGQLVQIAFADGLWLVVHEDGGNDRRLHESQAVYINFYAME